MNITEEEYTKLKNLSDRTLTDDLKETVYIINACMFISEGFVIYSGNKVKLGDPEWRLFVGF